MIRRNGKSELEKKLQTPASQPARIMALKPTLLLLLFITLFRKKYINL